MSAQMHVWRGGLSGRYFAGKAHQLPDGTWVATGGKHDVTDDIEALIATAASNEEDPIYAALGHEIAWEVEKYGDPYLMGVMARVRAGDGFTQNGEPTP